MNNLKPNTARRAGYALHVLTASGAVIGMLALQGVVDGEIRIALLWLIASQILDGLDGPIARGLDVEIHAPLIDGHVLDLVVQRVDALCVLARQFGTRHLCTDEFGRPFGVATVHLTRRLGQVTATTGQDAVTVAGTVAAQERDLDRCGEVAGDALEVAFGGRTQQPHEQKESHHGRHEVGVGDLPRAPVRYMPALLDALDDDRL